jgi:type III pantothenate kinase
MILEVDMGNTRLKWRIRDQQVIIAKGAIPIEAPLDSLINNLGGYSSAIDAVIVASVVGDLLEQSFSEWSLNCLKLRPVFLRSEAICGSVRNGYRQPAMLGVDRWLGIVAAYRLVGNTCIVVSCGTAVTVDLVACDGQHLGGFIAPGLSLMLDSLVSKTRQIKVDGDIPVLSLSPATSTSDAIHSACAAMLTGLVNNGVQQLRELDQNNEPEIIFTGGDAGKLRSFYPQARLIPDLVMEGFTCVLEYPTKLE